MECSLCCLLCPDEETRGYKLKHRQTVPSLLFSIKVVSKEPVHVMQLLTAKNLPYSTIMCPA